MAVDTPKKPTTAEEKEKGTMQVQLTIELPEHYATRINEIPDINDVVSHAGQEALKREEQSVNLCIKVSI